MPTPLHDYQCPDCSHQFEVKQSFRDKPYARCPRCETESRRVFRPVPIIYKGIGFYTTDYGRKGQADSGSESSSKAKEPAAAAAD